MKITAATLPVGARFVHAVPAADAVPVRVVSPSRSSWPAPSDMVNVYVVTLTQGLFGPAGRKVTLCYYADEEVEATLPESQPFDPAEWLLEPTDDDSGDVFLSRLGDADTKRVQGPVTLDIVLRLAQKEA